MPQQNPLIFFLNHLNDSNQYPYGTNHIYHERFKKDNDFHEAETRYVQQKNNYLTFEEYYSRYIEDEVYNFTRTEMISAITTPELLDFYLENLRFYVQKFQQKGSNIHLRIRDMGINLLLSTCQTYNRHIELDDINYDYILSYFIGSIEEITSCREVNIKTHFKTKGFTIKPEHLHTILSGNNPNLLVYNIGYPNYIKSIIKNIYEVTYTRITICLDLLKPELIDLVINELLSKFTLFAESIEKYNNPFSLSLKSTIHQNCDFLKNYYTKSDNNLKTKITKPRISVKHSENYETTSGEARKNKKRVVAFKWKLPDEAEKLNNIKQKETINYELQILHSKLADTVKCSLGQFQEAFSGKEITKPINIHWIRPASRNKTTPDYSSIFNFLDALIKENKIDSESKNNEKTTVNFYEQVGMTFCHTDSTSFFKEEDKNANLRVFKYNSTLNPYKTEYFRTLLK